MRNIVGVPRIYYKCDEQTKDGKIYHVIVMELLGKNLEDLLEEYGKFDIGTSLKIGVQLTERIRDIHNQRIIHRDIKA